MARIAQAGVEAVAGGRERRLVFSVLETHKVGVKVKYYLSYLSNLKSGTSIDWFCLSFQCSVTMTDLSR